MNINNSIKQNKKQNITIETNDDDINNIRNDMININNNMDNFISTKRTNTITSITTNTIDSFITFYTYDIVLMSENIKKQYIYNPCFLSKLTSSKLIDFIIDILYENNYFYIYNRFYKKFKLHQSNLYKLKKYQVSQLTSPIFDSFKKSYNTENNTSFNIIYNFFRRFNIKLEYNNWLMFCYMNSTHYIF